MCVESSTGCRGAAPWELGRLEPPGDNVDQPSRTESPGPKEVQEGSEQKGFLLEPWGGFVHVCSERENWRRRGAVSYFCFPLLPGCRR